ncbi:MAG: preprotein translocase subunit SecA, partial [Syntrophaceae bacterium]|nr:preprotein translocase subunit SecA [Syntrophaceae bacterium]
MEGLGRITYLMSRKAWQHCRRGYYRKLVRQAGVLEAGLASVDDKTLAGKIGDLGRQLSTMGKLGPVLAQALALGREVSRRKLGMRHYDVQLIGTLALFDGCIAEMDTGEGKTLMAPLAAWMYLLERPEHNVHIVTANEYLAQRDAQWMAPIYEGLGLSVGVVLPGQSPSQRRKAYGQKVVYSAAKDVVFDSLREPMRQKQTHMVDAILRPDRDSALDVRYDFAIVDEVDSVLIDQARSPMALGGSGDGSSQVKLYQQADAIAGRLLRGEHYRLMHDDRKIELKEEGKAQARREAQVAGIIRLLPPGHLWQRYVTCALAARHLYKRDEHYVVREGKVVLLDESTGRMIPGRQLPDGIHQAIEVRNGLLPSVEIRSSFQTTFQTYFRKYSRLAGMTGTASMAAREFLSVYDLPVMPIPSNRPSQRHIHPDRVFRSLVAKFRALIEEIERLHATGRPLLIGTGSVKISEDIGRMLD